VPLAIRNLILAAAALILPAVAPAPITAMQAVQPFANSGSAVRFVSHIAPYTCGVTSSKFARICRPQADVSCKSAVTRGVAGFSKTFCAARHTACSSCLAMLRRCIGHIGHGKRSEFSCDECTGKFSRCIGRRYPVLKN
jgi:hypothetical protein